jgi:hypothetical protein
VDLGGKMSGHETKRAYGGAAGTFDPVPVHARGDEELRGGT